MFKKLMSKSSLVIASLLLGALVLSPSVAFAANSNCSGTSGNGSSSNPITGGLGDGSNDATGGSTCVSSTTGDTGVTNSIRTIAGEAVNIFSIIVGVVSVIMIIYGGFRYVTSGGDSGKVGNAKNTLIYAIIGLVIVALAQLIVHYVLNTASGISTSNS